MLPAYGVTIGTFDHSGAHQGKWLHELLYLRAGETLYECAVDVNEPTGIFQYLTLGSLDQSLFQAISTLPDGYHSLARDSTSGAIDYIRSPLIQQPEGCLTAFSGVIGGIFGAKAISAWNDVTGDEAGNALVGLVTGSSRVYVFGAPYSAPNPYPGMHDVHMNQGDPIASPFHPLDGIWQDGCVIVDGRDGKLAGYFGKFATQSLTTDPNGWPT
jgi:Uncharacterized conserved protein (DUF2278)